MAEIVLTKEQQAVVDNRGGTLLVSAAAGSGKTKVLIDRVLKKVTQQSCNVDDFLMITFTQAAASELRGKLIAQLSQKLAEDPSNRHLQKQMSRVYLAQISTVHAFCAILLREYAHTLLLPADFRICDEQEGLQLRQKAMLRCLEQAYIDAKADPCLSDALDMLGAGRDDSVLPELILKVYREVQNYRDPKARIHQFRDSLQPEKDEDAANTIWGSYLMSDFQHYLAGCEKSFSEALDEICACESLLPYEPTFRDNLLLIQSMKSAKTWDELHGIDADFGKLKGVKKCADPQLQIKVKEMRTQTIASIRKRLEKFCLSSEELLSDLRKNASALTGLLRLTESFSDFYAREKQRRHVLDYNDLEHETLRLLLGKGTLPSLAAREISQRFEEIMVDEYQDTNAVQDALFYAISKNGENLFFVGDVKQAIYGFRMADPTIFLNKYKSYCDYTAAQGNSPRRILLSDNFRSHPEILDAANAVFRLTMTPSTGGLEYTDAEALRPKRVMPQMPNEAVELHCVDTKEAKGYRRDEIEAEFIASRIGKMLQDGELIPDGDSLRPIRPEDIVILFRALSTKAPTYLEALRRHNIHALCADDDLFEADEITVLTSLLQIIDNPHQDIPLLSVLLSPLFRFPTGRLAKLRAADRKSDLYELLCGCDEAKELLQTLSELRDVAQGNSLRSLLDEIDERLYLRSIFGAMDAGQQRIRHIERFYALADTYERGDRFGLSGFLRYLELVKKDCPADEASSFTGAVRLMTVHHAKGLEFPVVYLADLSKAFNLRDTSAKVLTDPVLGIGACAYDKEQRLVYPTLSQSAISRRIRSEMLSEEMRILYVAMTRAQYRMVMSCCASNMENKLTELAREITVPARENLLSSVSSVGDWVLMTALTRTEAGALFAVGGNSAASGVSKYPWRICYHSGLSYLPDKASEQSEREETSEDHLLAYKVKPYFAAAATKMPSKLTATQMKNDSSPQKAEKPEIHFAEPRFYTGKAPLTGAQRGTAIHMAMQFIRYEACDTEEGVRQELLRLFHKRFLTKEQYEAVSVKKILQFFRSAIGERILNAQKVVREFKFSLLEDASYYEDALIGEQILLQGVTDCCIIEEDGLVVVDFKSDHIKAGQEAQRAEFYRGQLDAYSRALSRIFKSPVKERVLYFFATDTAYHL